MADRAAHAAVGLLATAAGRQMIPNGSPLGLQQRRRDVGPSWQYQICQQARR
jgi:hypothetical protein